MRRRFSATFKAQVVQEVLRGEKTLAQIAAKHKIHPNMIGQWKLAALKGMPTIFDENRNAAAVKAEHDAELQELFEQIGRLSIENAWLKKFWYRTRQPLSGEPWLTNRRAVSSQLRREIPHFLRREVSH